MQRIEAPKNWRVEQPRIRGESDYDKMVDLLYPKHLHDLEKAMYALQADRQAKGETWITFMLDGPFWFPRGLLGVEPHLYAVASTPAGSVAAARRPGRAARPTLVA